MNEMVIKYCRKQSRNFRVFPHRDRQDISQIGILAALEADGRYDIEKAKLTTWQCYKARKAMLEVNRTKTRRGDMVCAVMEHALSKTYINYDYDRTITGRQVWDMMFDLIGTVKTVCVAHFAYGYSLKDCGKLCGVTESRAAQLKREGLDMIRGRIK